MTYTFHPEDAETTVFAALLDAARKHGRGTPILEDVERKPLTYGRLILGSLVLGAKVVEGTAARDAVGVLLPNVNAMPLTILGLNAYNRVAALLNFTAGPRNLVSAAKTAVVRRVVTSRRFVETAKLEDAIQALAETETAPSRRVEVLYLEDVRKSIGTLDKAKGLARAALAARVHRRSGARPGDTAVILFTSGTEGAPKGVALTNANIVANALQTIDHGADILDSTRTMINPLPIFHSFGLTAATIMPLLKGIKVVLHPSPLQYRQVAAMIRETGAELLVATDTFLQGYVRAAEKGDLASLRFVVLGAERVKEQTRALWAREGLGAHLLEGYGVTETAPVLACNLPYDNKIGAVGRLLPHVEARLEPVEGITEGGRLHVRGPNVMAGYIAQDRPGVVVPLPGGWHDTGDIATIEDGYVAIRGRAKRFAKIGGEMVSLAAVEALASGLWPDAQHVVVTLPDARKGEQLVLVTDKPDAARDALLAHARSQGFSDLWVPKALLVAPAIPVLGTGKVDFAATREMALQARALS